MEPDLGDILADLLNSLEFDDLAIHLVTEFSEGIGDLSGADATVDISVGASLGYDHGANALESSGCGLGLVEDLLDLMGLLTLVLGQHLQSCVAGDHCQSLGNQVVAAIAVLYLNDIILIT